MTHSEQGAQQIDEHLPQETFIWMLQQNSITQMQNNAMVFTCQCYYELEAPHSFIHCQQTLGDKWGANQLLFQMGNFNTGRV